MKVQINGRTLTRKGLAVITLATGITVSALGLGAYTALDHAVDAVVADVVGTQEVTIEWGTEVESIVDAIKYVNGDLNGPKLKQAIDEFHYLNNTWALDGRLQDVKAGTYLVPVIK